MSADSPTSQASWKTKHSFPYSLLSDRSTDRRVLKALGVNKGTSISRSHIVIGKSGVVEALEYGVSPKDSVQLATDFVVSSSK
jgi:peroxiredoxin Q/BCP